MASLAPVPSESNTCANCGAALVSDQRYCLTCGQPVSPVRLAFLDVLESERQSQPTAVGGVPVAYTPYVEPTAGPVWLRRYAPLFGVLSVLGLALIVGLLVGHWVTQSKSGPTGPQVIKVEGLASAPAVAGTGTTATTPTSTTPSAGASSAKSEEAAELAEAKKEEEEEAKHPPKAPAAKALNKTEATKLEKSTGKNKEAELNKITTAPIEVK